MSRILSTPVSHLPVQSDRVRYSFTYIGKAQSMSAVNVATSQDRYILVTLINVGYSSLYIIYIKS